MSAQRPPDQHNRTDENCDIRAGQACNAEAVALRITIVIYDRFNRTGIQLDRGSHFNPLTADNWLLYFVNWLPALRKFP